MITIGTDCSGIEAPIEALKQLGIPFQHKWACEIDKFARQSILANYQPETLFEDITVRNHSLLPDVDIYACGFPCQSFSSMGKRKGTKDPRGNIMMHCIDVIKLKRPSVFILENVKNFKYFNNGFPFNKLISELESITNYDDGRAYKIYPVILNTKDYGIPQNRARIYIIGINQGVQIREFNTPSKLPLQPLDAFITDTRIHTRMTSDHSLLRNLQHFDNTHNNNIATPFTFYYPMYNCSPTLTTKCGSFYHTKYNRTLNPQECLLLQGFTSTFNIVVSKSQICKQAGNAMSVNVLKVLLREILNCTILQFLL
jgi:DNA (cytosine-5)-methyltransferase 1